MNMVLRLDKQSSLKCDPIYQWFFLSSRILKNMEMKTVHGLNRILQAPKSTCTHQICIGIHLDRPMWGMLFCYDCAFLSGWQLPKIHGKYLPFMNCNSSIVHHVTLKSIQQTNRVSSTTLMKRIQNQLII